MEKQGINKKTFGDRLHHMRRIHNKTQAEIGEAVGVGKSYISGIEKGRLSPGIEVIMGLKRLFAGLGDAKTYDFWIEGIDFKADGSQIKKGTPDDIAFLKSVITDKEDLLNMYKLRASTLEAKVKELGGSID